MKYPQYFSTSSGNTEDAVVVFSEDVPYLKSVESPGKKYHLNMRVKSVFL